MGKLRPISDDRAQNAGAEDVGDDRQDPHQGTHRQLRVNLKATLIGGESDAYRWFLCAHLPKERNAGRHEHQPRLAAPS